MKRVLITGGAGFIGANFVRKLFRNRFYDCCGFSRVKETP